MEDVLGNALKDFEQGCRKHTLWIHNKYGDKEKMPVKTYFRSIKEMSQPELIAMEACTGKILDVGAAAGCHSLILQQRKLNVTALDVSAGAIEVMKLRGIKKVIHQNIFSIHKKQFDTMLFFMNGIGIAQTLKQLEELLKRLKLNLKPGGYIIFDSSDVRYLYNQTKLPQHYYGEIDYRYEYRNKFSEWFKWLYVDKQTMKKLALRCGYKMEVLFEDESGEYLARLIVA